MNAKPRRQAWIGWLAVGLFCVWGLDAGRSSDSLISRARALKPGEWVELLLEQSRQSKNSEMLRLVELMEESRPGLAGANDLYLLAGDAAVRLGDWSRALRFFRAGRQSGSPLAELLSERELKCLLRLDRVEEAEALYASLTTASRRGGVCLEIGGAWSKAGRPDRAESFYRRSLADGAIASQHGSLRLELAKLLVGQGRPADAIAELGLVLESKRRTQAKSNALRELLKLQAGERLSYSEHLSRGQLLLESGDFEAATAELGRALEASPSEGLAAEAVFLQGRVQYRRERFEEALREYLAAYQRAPEVDAQQRYLSHAARCLTLLKREEEANRLQQKIVKLEPKSESAGWAYFEMAARLERQGKPKEALRVYGALAVESRHAQVISMSLLQCLRLQMDLGQFTAAAQTAKKLQGKRGKNIPEARLYLARALDSLGQRAAAISAYQSCASALPNTLYQKMALQRLGELTGKKPALVRAPRAEAAPAALPKAPAFASPEERDAWLAAEGELGRAKICLKLDLRSEALGEMAALETGRDSLLWSLLRLANQLGRPHQALAYAERLAEGIPWAARPAELLRELYPRAFIPTIEGLAKNIQIDPWLVLAVVRQESRYNPEARSFAAARGLMQIVPVTFEALKRSLGKSELGLDDLHRPEVGLELGMSYLQSLAERFDGRPEVMLAAYNAGPENAERWLAQARSSDPLDFISTISFKETRDYVRIVLHNWWMYRDLYADGLKAGAWAVKGKPGQLASLELKHGGVHQPQDRKVRRAH